jgi:uncharacterized protein
MAVLCRLSYSSSFADDSACMRRLAITLLLLASGCGGPPGPEGTPTPSSPAPATSETGGVFGRGVVTITTASGDVTLDVEVAESPAAHARGLMGRPEMAEDAGMAFVFADVQPRRFWMKDTLIPLSIAFAAEDGRIVAILDMEPCTADPCHIYESGAPAQLALEVNQGFFAERGIRTGDSLALVEG